MTFQDYLPTNYNIDNEFQQRRKDFLSSKPRFDERVRFCKEHTDTYNKIYSVCAENYSKATFLISIINEKKEERVEIIQMIKRLSTWFKANAVGIYDHNNHDYLYDIKKIHKFNN